MPFLNARKMRRVCHFFYKIAFMATSLKYQEKGPDRSFAPKTLSFGEEIVKIAPVDPEIIVLQAIIKKDKKKLEMRGKA